MVRPDQFYVEFTNRWAVYAPGDTVTGRVHLHLPAASIFGKSTDALCVNVQFCGAAVTFW